MTEAQIHARLNLIDRYYDQGLNRILELFDLTKGHDTATCDCNECYVLVLLPHLLAIYGDERAELIDQLGMLHWDGIPLN